MSSHPVWLFWESEELDTLSARLQSEKVLGGGNDLDSDLLIHRSGGMSCITGRASGRWRAWPSWITAKNIDAKLGERVLLSYYFLRCVENRSGTVLKVVQPSLHVSPSHNKPPSATRTQAHFSVRYMAMYLTLVLTPQICGDTEHHCLVHGLCRWTEISLRLWARYQQGTSTVYTASFLLVSDRCKGKGSKPMYYPGTYNLTVRR